MIRYIGRTTRDLWIYFKTGHSQYLIFSISLLNFISIQYQFTISKIPLASKYIPTIGRFTLIFALVYIPIATIIGIIEYKKGEIRRRPKLNPFTQDQIKSRQLAITGILSYIHGDTAQSQSNLSESIEVMKKWIH